jgi:serpin B
MEECNFAGNRIVANLLLAMSVGLIGQTSLAVQAQPDPEAQVAAESSNRFAVSLHKVLAKKDGNLFYSPASISMALGMTFAGAEGETRAQIGKVLHLPSDATAWLKSTERLLPLFNQTKEGFDISLANRLWGQKNFVFHPAYLELVEQTWHAPLGDLDFVGQAEQSRLEINRWVESQTNQRIKDLLPQGSLDANTRLVLTNAIFFKADWAFEFKRENTTESHFAVDHSTTVKVPLMSQRRTFNYYSNEQIQYLRLPYKQGDFCMDIILPKAADGLSDLEATLKSEDLNDWPRRARPTDVQVFLPRFKMDLSFSMKQTLEAMGMPRAFSGSAEFGGMTSNADLQISEVFHKAFVEVDEKGTEAAAATGAVIALASARPTEPIVFRADRPFLMLLRHQPTGLILFLGRVTKPG